MKVGVAGLGLIGGSVLRGLGDAVGYDADPAVRAAAAADGFEVVDAPDRLAGCELVLVAVPPAITYEVSDLMLAAETALGWAVGGPLVFGGDLNSARPAMPGLTHVGGHHVDHFFVAGGLAGGGVELLEAGALSDHAPLRARTSTAH